MAAARLDPSVSLALVAGLALVAFVAWKGGVGKAAAAAGAAVVDAADGVIGEAGNTAGDILGIPRTEKTACAAAKAAGNTLDASFACPASEFLSWVWNGRPSGGASGTW